MHRLVVSVDIRGSGRLDQQAKIGARRAMYEILETAFDAIGVPVAQVHLEDRGDGVLAALDPAVPPVTVVGVWLEEIHQGLRAHNRGRAEPLRLRIALHSGPVAHDGRGLVGRAVDLTCRLCDSEPARGVLDADASVGLVLVVSDVLYRTVVVEGGRFVEQESYASHPVRFKETDETAWFHVPRRSRPPLPEPATRAEAPVPSPTPAAAPPPASAPPASVGATPAGRSREEAPPGAPPPSKYTITVHGPNQIVDGAEVHGDITGVTHVGREGGTDE
ncbi:hypothetical protein ASE09_26925 [Streptomyces sp. Root66D1]|nr:hypothetical protein ASD33_30115 [Streptomyces sp. Root1304]KRA97115.1 hypothetical protein ASE09_26925 [Streptomyces sp. Root66D1]